MVAAWPAGAVAPEGVRGRGGAGGEREEGKGRARVHKNKSKHSLEPRFGTGSRWRISKVVVGFAVSLDVGMPVGKKGGRAEGQKTRRDRGSGREQRANSQWADG